MNDQLKTGVVTLPSQHSVDDTVHRLQQLLTAKGITIFAVIDHSGEAEKAGLHMPNTKLIIFGNPRGGTPLMLARPSIAIDLPLKILVSEDSAAKAWVSYSSAEFLTTRHDLPSNLIETLALPGAFAQQITR
jgi:uncharacterized protein (DUF302 family)